MLARQGRTFLYIVHTSPNKEEEEERKKLLFARKKTNLISETNGTQHTSCLIGEETSKPPLF